MNSGVTRSRAASNTLSCMPVVAGAVSELAILVPPVVELFRRRNACLGGAALHRERADHERRDDRSTSNRPKYRFRSARRLLQQTDDIRSENAADAPYPEFHADAARAKAGLIGIRGKIVEDMLGADHAKAGDRHDREIESVTVDKYQRPHGDAADRPPHAEQPRRCGKS